MPYKDPHKRREMAKKYARKYYEGHPEEWRDGVLKRKYGVSLEQKTQMYLTQNGSCAICQENMQTVNKACLDHDHTSGAIRGLLCSPCNKGLGFFKDNMQRLEQAKNYLSIERKLLRVSNE